MPAPVAAAIDLGTTRIKGALLRDDGTLDSIRSVAAPALTGHGLVRESDAAAYVRQASSLREALAAVAPGGLPLGLASQRSTFVLWERHSGAPVTPLISWQDRRAEAWCEAHPDRGGRIRRSTGLRLSPHYAGPKLASLLDTQPHLRRGLEDGSLAFGTLDTWVLWNWSRGAAHRTDPTMAVRTLLADPDRGAWSGPLLRLFGVPRPALPAILPSSRARALSIGASALTASLADQAAGYLGVAGSSAEDLLVNLGTGIFVLRGTGSTRAGLPDYLTGPIHSGPGGTLFAIEGTINGGGPTVDRFGAGPSELPVRDPAPRSFCVPDEAGWGAPHWRSDFSLVFSEAALRFDEEGRRRTVLEGLIFRVREIAEALAEGRPSSRILLSGGLAREPFLAEGLAACLARPIEVSSQGETTLLGAARLAAGWDLTPPAAGSESVRIEPSERGAYLASKYAAWGEWVRTLLAPG